MRSLFQVLGLLTCLLMSPGITIAEETLPVLPTRATRGEPSAGRYFLTVTSEKYEREIFVHVPRGYKPTSPPPLVVALHGAGGQGESMLDQNGWAKKADAEGFIVLAPNGLPALPKRSSNALVNPPLWNSGQLNERSPRTKIDDVAFIKTLLDQLKTQLPYDTNRVYVTGHSNGGGMTLRLAAELPERFVAAGTVAGLVNKDYSKPKKLLPTLYIYGMEDPVLPIDGGESKLPWGGRKTLPQEELLARWAEVQQCEATPMTRSTKNGVRRMEYPPKKTGNPFLLIYLEGHGHHWPGGKWTLPERMIGPDAKNLDATDELWSFFEKATRAEQK